MKSMCHLSNLVYEFVHITFEKFMKLSGEKTVCLGCHLVVSALYWPSEWSSKRQPTPVFLPGESQGPESLVGCHLWGHTELDMTEVT